MSDSLSHFSPVVAAWFRQSFGAPTEVQKLAWPEIASSQHVLITAPTGSGKTLTAFLHALDQLLTGKLSGGTTRVLYVSPLKALNNDIARNLLSPLSALSQAFREAGLLCPDIRVRTRSGDTPASDRRQLLRYPPEILITTPESLHLMLTSSQAQASLTQLATVIVDEVHAVASSRRGVLLAASLERLTAISGEFQRIALSATVKPLSDIAALIGGFSVEGPPEAPVYSPRSVKILEAPGQKVLELTVKYPPEVMERSSQEALWEGLVLEFKRVVGTHRSTLIFTRGRRLCEKLTHKLNLNESSPLAWSHHGSLSKEIRLTVEEKLKAGELKAIVATSSLEMGIDIGALDEVLMVQTPFSVSSTLQRLGRAGHRVGEVSRGTLYPTFPLDFLEAAVMAKEALERNIEATRPLMNPLDALAQILVSMLATSDWDLEGLFASIRAMYPFHTLPRGHFDLVLQMLAGRYEESRIRELRAKVSIDEVSNTVSLRKGATLDLYLSGGVIPDRGYYQLRFLDTGARIGELDEEFVWEARVGEIFSLGAQNWRIERITQSDVFATPANPAAIAPPFWRSEQFNRDFHFSERIGLFLEDLEARLSTGMKSGDLKEHLRRHHFLDENAAETLKELLLSQREQSASALPHRHHLVLEHLTSGPDGSPGHQLILHTLWGGRVNRPYALALEAAWEAKFGERLELFVGNHAISLLLPQDVEPESVLSLVTVGNLETLLRQRLEGSALFGAQFREAAGRALLLSRRKAGQRLPLWMSRLKSQRLLEAVRHFPDFPILLEAWRSCLQDELDLEALRLVLSELEAGAIRWTAIRRTLPTPFGRADVWRQVNTYMYMDDTPSTSRPSSLRADLIKELLRTSDRRLILEPALIERLIEKRQRLASGYAPTTALELIDFVAERVFLTEEEWRRLLEAVKRDTTEPGEETTDFLSLRLAWVRRPSGRRWRIARSMLERIATLLSLAPGDGTTLEADDGSPLALPAPEDDDGGGAAEVVAEWLRAYGPWRFEMLLTHLEVEEARLETVVQSLVETGLVWRGALTGEGELDQICDAENFEILLRMARTAAVPVWEPLGAAKLALFLAMHQGMCHRERGVEAVGKALEQLALYPSSADAWEGELLPTRVQGYMPALLDSVLLEGAMQWRGIGPERITFGVASDFELLNGWGESAAEEGISSEVPAWLSATFRDPLGSYDYPTLLQSSSVHSGELTKRLWEAVWAGQITNDSMSALRKGIANRFRGLELAEKPAVSGRTLGRAGFSRWKGTQPSAGRWRRLPTPERPSDLLEAEERHRERVRVVLERYGVVFRELLLRELPALRWAGLFRTLRLMELSGEVLAGCFFRGIEGLQFISHAAFRTLSRGLPSEAGFWHSAQDPASLCGLHLSELEEVLPRRTTGSYVAWEGSTVALVVRRDGAELEFRVPPEYSRMGRVLEVVSHLLSQGGGPHRRVIETINGVEAASSPYVDALRIPFEVSVEMRKVIVYRRLE